MLDTVKRIVDENFVFQQDSASCSKQSNCCSAKPSTSFLLYKLWPL